jgi:hypothetical protein
MNEGLVLTLMLLGVRSDNYLGQSATIMMAGRVVHERRL